MTKNEIAYDIYVLYMVNWLVGIYGTKNEGKRIGKSTILLVVKISLKSIEKSLI